MAVHSTSEGGYDCTGFGLEFVKYNLDRFKMRFTVGSCEHFVLEIYVFEVGNMSVHCSLTMEKNSKSYVTLGKRIYR